MNHDTEKLSLHRLSRAQESLKDAELLLKNDALSSAVNRYYYAAFYAARALLALKGLDSSKHSGVISLFQQHYVKTGIIPPETAKALPNSFEERVDMDYEDFAVIERSDIEVISLKVKSFVECCAQILRDITNKTK